MSSIETKVIAATAGSGLGAALSAFFLWIVGVFAFGASFAADQVPKALAAVPEPVGALLAILVAILGAFVGGYAAPHTHRPDLSTVATVVNNAIHDVTPSVDANGHVRLDFADGKAMFWDEAKQTFMVTTPTPTPPVAPVPVVGNTAAVNTSGPNPDAGTVNMTFPPVTPESDSPAAPPTP